MSFVQNHFYQYQMTFERFRSSLLSKIENIQKHNFEEVALEVFQFQATYNPLYKSYLDLISFKPTEISALSQIPFLPIQLFKKYTIQTGQWSAEQIFSSSGTTSQNASFHHLRSKEWYQKIATTAFHYFYGSPKDYCFLGLLPAYLERQGSSLIYMVQEFIQLSKYNESGFFLYNTESLLEIIEKCRKRQIPTVLIGVSFALLDLAEQHAPNLGDVIVMETGGMKGRRKEITRKELHTQLQNAFGIDAIHSEYGMTELFSQAYSKGNGIFYPSPAMKILANEVTDPFARQKFGKTGVLQVVDLGNIDTISFIATEDLTKVYKDGSFEVLGRLDASDIRGCNLLIGA